VLGTLTLGHHQAEYFSPADLEVCHPAASMLAGAILAERLRVATMKEAEEKALLFRELDHRVRNHLAALISLLHLGAEGSDGTAAERMREMGERVARVAEVHNLLSGRGIQPIEVRELAEGIAKNVLVVALPGSLKIEWTVTGDTIRVPPSQVTAIALILNELLTNCIKHAFPGRAAGTVTIRVGHEDHQIELEVQDDGVGLNPAKHPPDLGMAIVQTIATQTLRGTVRFAAEGGTRVTIRFPRVEETPEGDSV
jgi:two-component sensor histidine kinase